MPDDKQSTVEHPARQANTALEALSTGVLIFAPAGALEYGNDAARRLLPLSATKTGPPQNLSELAEVIPHLDISRIGNSDHRVRSRWLRVGVQTTANESTIVQVIDITDLKQSEGTLVNARDMALLADRAKSEFLANMTHELRTPLNAVIGFAEVLRDELFGPLGNPRYQDFITDIHDSGRHLLAIIEDILDLSKLEVGRRDLQPEVMDIADTIFSAARMIARRAESAGLTLRLEPDDDLPLLNGEERSIKQIILNLLSNAVKFTDPGGSIFVHATCNQSGGLDLSVADTGIGIAQQDLQRVFTPFVQVETGRRSQANGAGLGLPLVKSLAEMHSARVTIDSTPGVGTTITIRFPASALVTKPSDG
ncbi:MAG: ATP-binding protein [Proteobacteria bacterium]|nr:ATP-binding protein [Pseudomonadota bacterium]